MQHSTTPTPLKPYTVKCTEPGKAPLLIPVLAADALDAWARIYRALSALPSFELSVTAAKDAAHA